MGLDENTRVSLAIVGVLIAGGVAYGALQFQANAHEKMIESVQIRQTRYEDRYSDDIAELKENTAVTRSMVENIERRLKESK